jgi:6-phosphogluconolactonase/glucosamine-6-phosphate isomerase/deaminase
MSDSSHIEIHANRETATNAIAQALHERIRGVKTVLLLSGGSSITVAVSAIAKLSLEERQLLRVGMTDERYGAYFHADSNWRGLCEAGFLELGVPVCYPVLTEENLSLEECAKRYNDIIANLISSSSNSIALFGIGTDDHIAGILPGSVAAQNSEDVVVGYDAGKFQRITIAPSCFARLTTAFVYAHGEEKRGAVLRLGEELNTIEHPNQLIKQVPTYTIYYSEQ